MLEGSTGSRALQGFFHAKGAQWSSVLERRSGGMWGAAILLSSPPQAASPAVWVALLLQELGTHQLLCSPRKGLRGRAWSLVLGVGVYL